jgi:hypothetical protein
VRGEALHHLAVLHHAQLRQHAHGLQVHAHRPQDLQPGVEAAAAAA